MHTYPEAQHLPGLVIYRFDAPLFFANAKTFRDEVRRLASSEPKPTWILIAAEPVTDVDTTASDMLEDLDEALNAQGTSLVFAELKDPVRHKIERYGLTRTIDPRHFFPTLESAVTAFRQETGAEWTAVDQATDDLTEPGQTDARNRPATRHSRITTRQLVALRQRRGAPVCGVAPPDTLPGRVTGAKPAAVCRWIFTLAPVRKAKPSYRFNVHTSSTCQMGRSRYRCRDCQPGSHPGR